MTHGTDEPSEPVDADTTGEPVLPADDADGVESRPRPGAHAAPAAESGDLQAGSFEWSYGASPDPAGSPEAQYPAAQYEAEPYQADQYQADAYQADQYRSDPQYQADAQYQPDQYQADPQYPAEPQYPVPPTAQQQSYEQYPGYPQQGYEQQPAAQPYQQQSPPQGYGQQQFTPQAPPPVPRPEDLLVPNLAPATDEPASWGWRGRMNRASGGMIKPKASPAEVAVRKSISDIQHSFSRPMTVVVVQPKGGAGKTPTTICLAAALGAHRGGYVVGWDDNETRGTLAVRVTNPDNQQTTVWNLLSDLAAFERYDARVGDLSRYVRAQPDAHFDALVSDDNPGNMAQIGETEYKRLHTVLQRFYRMIIVDTGNNVRSSNWQAAVHSADQIVVVSTYQRDVGYSASWVLDHLAQSDRPELARNAVTVLSAADPTTDKEVRDQLVPHFQARTRAVCEIPYDTELAHGGPIRWTQLAPATRNAWIHAGATVVNCLADDDSRALAARPT